MEKGPVDDDNKADDEASMSRVERSVLVDSWYRLPGERDEIESAQHSDTD